MNQDILRGSWKQVKGDLRQKRGELTDNHIDRVEGKIQKLLGLLQEKYGILKRKGQRRIGTPDQQVKDHPTLILHNIQEKKAHDSVKSSRRDRFACSGSKTILAFCRSDRLHIRHPDSNIFLPWAA